MAITQATDPPLKHPELRSAMDVGYRELLKAAVILVHKRRSWLQASSRLEMAENIVQEALHRAWKNADRFDTSRRPLAWLMGFVQRVASEELRAERKLATPAADLDGAWDQALALLVNSDQSMPRDMSELLRRARSLLPEEQQRILTLHFDEGLPGEELAQRMGLPSNGAARTAKCRALAALRAVYLRLADGEETTHD
jgi:RNA polymerase sigma factor (sigma-70 family)